MSVTRRAARPLLASIFVTSGFDALRAPDSKAPAAEKVAEALGQPASNARNLVQLNGAVQLGAGLCLAAGKAPRLSAAVLAGSLVPTTYAGHRFWEVDDPAKRNQQRTQFLKNLSILGGLVIAAFDTEGRPGVTYRASEEAHHLVAMTRRSRRRASRKAARRGAGAVATAATTGRWVWRKAREAEAAGAALGRELAPQVRDQVMEIAPVVRDQVREMAPVVRDQVREMAPVVRDQVREMAPVVRDQVREMAPVVRDQVREIAPVVRDQLRELVPHVREISGAANQHLSTLADLARDSDVAGRAKDNASKVIQGARQLAEAM